MKPIYKIYSNYVDLLEWRAELTPERIAYRYLNSKGDEESVISYQDLHYRACRIATILQNKLKVGDRVMLLYPQGIDFLAGFFGCLYAGMIAVTVYPPKANRTLLRLKTIIEDSEANLALTTGEVYQKISKTKYGKELGIEHWYSTDKINDVALSNYKKIEIPSDSIAFLQYTSGSTSKPKGVAVTHKNLLHNQEMIKLAYNHSENTNYVSWLPLFHDMGLIGNALQTIYIGSTCTLMSPATFIHNPILWLKAISKYKAHTSGAPNFGYAWCVQNISSEDCKGLDLSNWKVAFNGAEPVRYETQQEFLGKFGGNGIKKETFCSCYGLAEATLFVTGGSTQGSESEVHVLKESLRKNIVETQENPDTDTQTIVSCGVSWGDQNVIIVDSESRKKLKSNEIGEIWISGPNVTSGYWNNEILTNNTFKAHLDSSETTPYLRSGDLGFIRNNQLFITGRIKDVINIRGRNYYPQDIEITVEKVDKGLRSNSNAAFTINVEGEEKLVVVQEVERTFRKKPHNFTAKKIRRAVDDEHEIEIYSIVFIKPGSIPKTTSGKIQRKACMAAYINNELSIIFESIKTNENLDIDSSENMEEWLISTIADNLNIELEELDLNKALSNYGLNSLAIVRMIHQIETHTKVNLGMTGFFEHKPITLLIKDIINHIEEVSNSNQKTNIIKKYSDTDYYPLSHRQRSIYFMHKLAPNSIAYNITKALRLNGELNIHKLKSAFEIVINNNPALKTIYSIRNGEPTQKINYTQQLNLVVEDISEFTDKAIKNRIEELSHLSFDLEVGPVYRFHLLTNYDDKHILFLSIHHIAVDFWSLGLFISQLTEIYQLNRNTLIDNHKYVDFVNWEENLLSSNKGQKMYDFWSKKLSGQIPVLELPFDKPRPKIQGYKGASHIVKITDIQLIDKVKKFTNQNGVTLYIYLLAAYQILLNKYTGMNNFTIGTPMLGRNNTQFANTIGYFVNPIVIKTEIFDDLSFGDFLKITKNDVVTAFDNQDYPFDLLVEKLQPTRELSHSPLFQVMFAMQNSNLFHEEGLTSLAMDIPGESARVNGLVFENYPLEQKIAQYDLTQTVAEMNDELVFSFEYNTDLFKTETIQRLSEYYIRIIETIIENPDIKIKDIDLTIPEDVEIIRKSNAKYKNTEKTKEVSIIDLFKQNVVNNPSAIAINYFENGEDKTITYRELDNISDQLALELVKIGTKPEDLIGIYNGKSMDIVASILAVLKVGAVYVPLDPKLPSNRIKSILEETKISTIITTTIYYHNVSNIKSVRMIFSDSYNSLQGPDFKYNSLCNIDKDNASCIIYTSGSTGTPKGVVMTYDGIVNLVVSFIDSYNVDSNDKVLPITSVSSASFVGEILPALCSGASLLIVDDIELLDVDKLIDIIEKQQVSIISSVPSMISRIGMKINHLPYLRLVLSGGDDLKINDIQSLLGKIQIVNGYGLTETSVCSTYSILEEHSESAQINIGKSVINHYVYILDNNLNEVPIGVQGEIYIGGSGVARGYLNNPVKTAERFLPDPFIKGNRMFRTGDMGRWLDTGDIEYKGRIDRQIKIRGYRVESGEIEQALLSHPEINECVVELEQANSNGNDILISYLKINDGTSISKSEITTYLRERLPEYMIPMKYLKVNSIPYLPNGKVDFQKLKLEKAKESLLLTEEYAAPQSEIQREVYKIWSEVLGVDTIGIRENFFDIGGHSLAVMQVQSKLEERFNKEVPIVDLFRHSSIKMLSDYLSDEKENSGLKNSYLKSIAHKRRQALRQRVKLNK